MMARAVITLVVGFVVGASEASADPLLERARRSATEAPVLVVVTTAGPPSMKQAASASSSQRTGPSRRRRVLLGALIGTGTAMGIGAVYCGQDRDCGGGAPRGALVFAPFGAGIGAALGWAADVLAP